MSPSISSHLSSSLSYTSRSTSSLQNTLTQPSNLSNTLTLPSNTSTMSTNSQQQQQQQHQHQHHHHHHKNSCSTLLKLSSILPPSSTNLQIKLIEPILYFRGDTEESVGCFLRGNLILNLSKPTKIRKVKMKFVGRMRTFWPEGKLYYGSEEDQDDTCEEQEILSHNWTFVSPPSGTPSGTPPETPPSSPLNSCSSPCRFKMLRSSSFASPSSTLIPAGVHKYPFELFIPGDVPETIDSVRGKVNYKLSAIAVRSGLLPNMHVSQTVTIIRTVLEERNSEGIAIASEWNNQLGYDITIPKKAYPIGNSIDVDLRLSPRAKNIKIVRVKIQINEESVYKSKNRKNVKSRTLSVHDVDNLGERRVIPDKSNDTFQEESSSSAHQDENYLRNFYYHKIISLPIPKCTSSICHSYKTPSINISHHLNFIFTLNSPVKPDNEAGKKKKKKSEINVNVPITLLSCRCAEDLPQYEDVSYNFRRYNDDSPSYESPPSYEQSTNNNGRLRINNEIRHNSANSITTIADLRRPPPLDRLLTV